MMAKLNDYLEGLAKRILWLENDSWSNWNTHSMKQLKANALEWSRLLVLVGEKA